MFFLEKKEFGPKQIRGAAGLCNSASTMCIHAWRWKQIAVCEERAPLDDIVKSLPVERQGLYQITSNQPENS